MLFNQKGDYILYIIITILAILIGAILYFVYTGSDSPNNSTTQDSNFISEFKSKMPQKDVFNNSENYTTTYPIKAKIALDMKIEINDKNVLILGNPNLIVSERSWTLENPELTGFTGTIDKTGLSGGLNRAIGNTFDLDIRATTNINYENIESIIIKDIELDLENSNINGELDIQGKPHALNKSYLQIKGFSGDLKIIPGNDSLPQVELDGNVGYLKIIDGIEEITLK